MCFTCLIGIPAHISFAIGLSSGGWETEMPVRHSEQFGVDQNAKAWEFPEHTAPFPCRLSASWRTAEPIRSALVFPLNIRLFNQKEWCWVILSLGAVLGILLPWLFILPCQENWNEKMQRSVCTFAKRWYVSLRIAFLLILVFLLEIPYNDPRFLSTTLR